MRMAEHQLKVRCRVERRTRSTISNQKFADSLLEGSGFEPSVPLLRKALLGVANRRRRHEGRSHLQVRDGGACLEWFPIAIPFAVGPMVRIRLPPPERHTNPGRQRSGTSVASPIATGPIQVPHGAPARFTVTEWSGRVSG